MVSQTERTVSAQAQRLGEDLVLSVWRSSHVQGDEKLRGEAGKAGEADCNRGLPTQGDLVLRTLASFRLALCQVWEEG